MVEGFTLFEVLITIFVLALGLIGFLQMDLITSQRARGTFFSSTAGVITTEYVERMTANQAGLAAGHYNTVTLSLIGADLPKDCGAAICSPGELATYDQWHWLNKVDSELPWDSAREGVGARVEVSGNAWTGPLEITIRWLEVGSPENDIISYVYVANVVTLVRNA
jgi:type IV pilus assembly protein PilV